jgi:hypothetical protein
MLTRRWVTDEDVAVRAQGDSRLFLPRDQRLATGSDGYFQPTDRWVLRSDQTRFDAQGILPGHLVQLVTPALAFRPPGELYVAETVGADWVRVRRVGMVPGAGQPPVGPSGLAGVGFEVVTVDPQIAIAQDEVVARLGPKAGAFEVSAMPEAEQGRLRHAIAMVALSGLYRALAGTDGGADARYRERALACEREAWGVVAALLANPSIGGDAVHGMRLER